MGVFGGILETYMVLTLVKDIANRLIQNTLFLKVLQMTQKKMAESQPIARPTAELFEILITSPPKKTFEYINVIFIKVF